jgi:hypothetical protein
VRIDAAQVALRPRSGWEAADLGFVMARAWWKELWGAWLAVFLPVALVLHAVFWERPMWAALILWWLKPLFDRVALHVLSHAVFGAPPTIRETLRAWREFLRPGLASALTLRRLSPVRSFTLPVWQLERLHGREASRRRSALGGRDRGLAALLTVVCVNLELMLFGGFDLLADLFSPAATAFAPDFAYWWSQGSGGESLWSLQDGFVYMLAMTIAEPLYVAAGFALYLNRRTLLEGWDIELALRALGQRLAAGQAAALLLGLVLLLSAVPPAIAAEKSVREEIASVLEAPEFGQKRTAQRWEYRGELQPPPKTPELEGWGNLVRFIAEMLQSVGWVAIALTIAVLVLAAWRHAGRFATAKATVLRPPQTLFGFPIAPASLPDDVAGAAIALAREGRTRDALSLLYRGALAALVHRYHLPLVVGSTEQDCFRLAARALERGAAAYFAQLIAAWQSVAYARRDISLAQLETLAMGWRSVFARQA